MPRVIRLELAQAGGAVRAVAEDIAPGDAMVTLGRGKLGMPHDEVMLSSNHAEVGWEKGVDAEQVVAEDVERLVKAEQWRWREGW